MVQKQKGKQRITYLFEITLKQRSINNLDGVCIFFLLEGRSFLFQGGKTLSMFLIEQKIKIHMTPTLQQRVAALEEAVKILQDKLPAKKFVKPTYDQVYDKMEESLTKAIGIVSPAYVEEQANLFIKHYESNGWKVGKASMKSWEAAISGTWVSNIKKKAFDNGNRRQGGNDLNRNYGGHV